MIGIQKFRKLKQLIAEGKKLNKAALDSNISYKTSRKYNKLDIYPVKIKPRKYLTREDPLTKIWPIAEAKLKIEPRHEATILFQFLRKDYPDDLPENALRTFQRRVKDWRASSGVSQEIFFSQVHIPGELSQSDFTHMESLKITINGVLFPHMLYHLVLTYSNWEFVKICQSESYENLANGFQEAMQDLGGVPLYHQTDQLTAAVTQYSSKEEFTKNYKDLMDHYHVIPLKTQVRKPNENGDVEKSHDVLKNAFDQTLLLRGSRDFQSLEEYKKYLDEFVRIKNESRHKKYLEEKEKINPLPVNPISYIKKYNIKLSKFSTLTILKNTYSLPSCFIGFDLSCWVDFDEIKVYFGNKLIATLPRIKGSGNASINYRDMIEGLVKKPGALKNWKYFDFMFPSTTFRFAYDYLKQKNPLNASKQYLKILNLALKNENKLELILAQHLQSSKDFDYHIILEAFNSQDVVTSSKVFDVKVPPPNLNIYDQLLQG